MSSLPSDGGGAVQPGTSGDVRRSWQDAVLGARLAQAQLTHRRARLVAGLLALFALIAVALELSATRAEAFGRALSPVMTIALPLAIFGLVGVLLGGRPLPEVLWTATRYGGRGRVVAAGYVLALAAAGALLGAGVVLLLGLVALPLGGVGVSDVATTLWIAALAGAAYSALFALASTFGRRGGGRSWVLVLDFLLGSAGMAGVWLPRLHVYNLAALGEPIAMSQPASSLALWGIAVTAWLGSSLRCPD